MQARLERLALAQADLGTVQQLNFDRYLIQRVDLFPLFSGFLGLDRSAGLAPADLSFVSDQEFRNLALVKLDVLLVLLGAVKEVDTALVAVQRSLTVARGR
jgi:hypothetical protein